MAEFKLGRIRFVWKAAWVAGTTYYKDDVVRFGGKTYICTIGHDADNTNFYTDLNAGPTRWNLVTEGQVWKGPWLINTFYKVGDIVKYGASVYVCNTPHTSAATATLGLEDSLGLWDLVNRSFDYLGTWSDASVRYKVNDVVKYGAGLWICTAYHTSDSGTTFEDDEASLRWAHFVDGLQFENSWDDATIYQPGDVVTYGGYAYISTSNHSNKTPTSYPIDWTILSTGFNFQNDWTSGIDYKIGSVVRLNGYTYLATADNTAGPGTKPPNTSYWQQLNPGYEWLGNWTTGFDYELGDTVKYGANSYVAVLTHTSSTPRRPDNDLSGTYWNLLTGGSESQVLTTQGDTVYYSGSGPARLPVGTDGQVLRVTGSNVQWKTFGAIANVWYVAPSGTDDIANGYGLTLDKPFKTIRYACNNITGPATIFAKTGTFTEVLPIIVPANVAIVGDELRSTVVQPAGNLIALGDVPYSKEALLRLKAIISDVIQNTAVSPSAGNTVTQDITTYTAGSGAAGTSAQTMIQNAYDWINYYISSSGSAPAITGSNTATSTTGYLNAASVLSVNRDFIATEVIQYIKSQHFIYDAVKCSRDVGYIIDATGYDLVLGTNYNRVVAGLAYQRSYSSYVIANQLANTVAAITYAKNQALTVSVNSDTTVTAVFTEILDILQNGAANADALTWTTPSNAATGAANANALLVSNRQFLIDEVTAFMNTNYSTFWAALSSGQKATCARDVGYIVDALCYDVLYGGNSASVGVAQSYYNGTATLVPNEQTETAAAVNRIRIAARDIVLNNTVTPSAGNSTPQVKDVPNPATSTQQTQLDTLCNMIGDVITVGPQDIPTVVYPDVSWGTTNAKSDRTALLAAKSSIQSATIAYINAAPAGGLGGYSFVQAACYRDVVEYVKAVEYDLVYTGNYKTLLAADWYTAAVLGSSTRNMFYLRNGTGLRNMTLSGLSGTLGSANQYGTKRPSAGAYVSLDPGFGTTDTSVQITTKSPYVQNVTTFGTGCIGMKIDGNLHGSGNKSIVANDFTQVLSDGIGMWVTNLARAELVSVFTYYNHVGYLAENGGKIRATNGNNSYGAFGSVSEGIDSTETPITATVNNRAYEAQVDYTFTNSSQIMRLEFTNAGSGYSTIGNTFGISGTGNNNVTTIGDEIRDNATFEVRLLTAGSGYVYVTNTAQTGNSTTITLAGSDTNGSGVYVGMRIVINSGLGVGQYGYVQAYNSGSKIATVYKESTGTAGWDHVIPGTTIASTLDSTTVYIIEPRVTFTAPTYTATSRTLQSGNWTASASAGNTFVAVANGGVASYSTNGTSWSAATGFPNASFTAVTAGLISSTNYFVAVASGGTQAAYSTNGSAWTTAALSGSATWTGVAYGNGRFVAIASGGTNSITSISTNGTSWAAGGNLPSSTTWTGVAYGSGPAKFVAVSGGGAASTAAAYSTDGATWTATTLPSANWTSVTYGNNMFVAVATGGTVGAYSFDGITWYASTLSASATWKEVRYGQGMFFAIAGYDGSATTVAASSIDGVNWTARAVASAAWTTIAFGSPSSTPIWVGAATGGTTAMSIPNFRPTEARAVVSSGQISKIRIVSPGSGYTSAGTMTITDPNQTLSATWAVRIGNGALANPSFTSRGTGYTTASTVVDGAGYADMYQVGYGVNVENMTAQPIAGSNIQFAGDSTVYKLVAYTNLLGGGGNYSALIQVSPALTITLAPEHSTAATIRFRYSQVRLTGHDFLSIGTGNFTNTNYPGTPLLAPDQTKECYEGGGGRVFFTSTDQDGNFRVGGLFSVEQSTGKSALNANAFNLSGLNELQLGTVTLGSSNTAVNEFSTDGTFAANSDKIVPTQKAIKTYIASQIGGGSASLNVNTITAGSVSIGSNTISTTSGGQIVINRKVVFTQGVDGSPLALNYFFR